jgi:hypothetical protein
MKTSRYQSLLSASLVGLALSAFWLGGSACRPTSEQGGGDGGSSGSGGSGGSSQGTGGTTSGSGGSGTGGAQSGSGGSSAGGAEGGSGGSGSGGAGSGGDVGGSGAGGTSGGSGAGGSSTPSSGGSGGGGTSSVLSGNSVTISKGKGSGAMSGYGWVALGSKDSISDPTCGGTPITNASSCESTTWNTTDSLCVSGSIPALPEKPSDSDYSSNWGLSVGLNASETAGTGIGQSFSTVSISVTGSPSSGLRAMVHRKGDPDTTSYCFAYAAGPLQLAQFSQDCYMTTPTKMLATSDIPNIDKVSIQVSSGGAEISVTKLCITGITFGN